MNSRIFVLSLATLAVIPLAAFAPAAIFAQQQQPTPSQTPSQPAPTQTPAQPAPQQTPTQPAPTQTPPAQPAPQQAPSQPAPTQTPPAQPAPQQTPSQPAPTQTPPAQPAPQQTPAQPATQPAMPEPEPQTTGPTTTIEGAVTNVVAYGCGPATATAAMRNQPRPTSPSSMPGAGPASGVPSAQQPSINPSPSTGQGCSAVLVITPGVNWAQVVQTELPASGENGGGLAGFGVPLRVVVGPKVALSTHDNADISLLDLPKGSVVKVDYAVRNDVPVATNIDVIWHAGQ